MKIEIDHTQLLHLLRQEARMEAMAKLVHSMPSYRLDEVLKAFFPPKPVEVTLEKAEG